MIFDELPIIETTIHDFKTNFSKYLRDCEEGRAQSIVVHRRKKMVGLFITSNRADHINDTNKEESDLLDMIKKMEDDI